jgi:Flp pilus assembly protein TadD
MKRKLYRSASAFMAGSFFILGISGCTTMTKLSSWFTLDKGQDINVLHTDQINTHYKIACRYQENGQHKFAIEEFKKVLRVNPKHAKSYNGMGISYDKLNNTHRAIGCYMAALKIDPDRDYIYNNLGYSYLQQGQLAEAISAFKMAIQLNDEKSRYYNNLGLAYAQQGKIDLAQAQFSRAGRMAAKAETAKDQPVIKQGHRVILAEPSPLVEEPNHTTQAQNSADKARSLTFLSEKAQSTAPANVESRITALSSAVQPEQPVAKVEPVAKYAKAATPTLQLNEKILPITAAHVQPATAAIRKTGPTVVATFSPAAKTKLHLVSSHQKTALAAPAALPKTKVAKQGPTPIKRVMAKPTLATAEARTDRVKMTWQKTDVQVTNGTGKAAMENWWKGYLSNKGVKVVKTTSTGQANHKETKVIYCEGFLQEAYQIAKQIPRYQNMERVKAIAGSDAKIMVIIGSDMIRFSGKDMQHIKIAQASIN